MIGILRKAVSATTQFQDLIRGASTLESGSSLPIRGIAGSLTPVVLGILSESLARQLLIVTRDLDFAERLRDDLHATLNQQGLGFFSGHKENVHLDRRRSVEDVEALRLLLNDSASITVTHPEAFSLRLPAPTDLSSQTVTIERGKEHLFQDIQNRLTALGFERKHFVETHGDCSVRGGILDVYPFVGENPVRLEFSGDVVESIREFDPVSQRSIKELSTAMIVPDFMARKADDRTSILDFLNNQAMIVLDEPELIERSLEKSVHPMDRFSWGDMKEMMSLFPQLHITSLGHVPPAIDFRSLPQPAFNGSVKALRANLQELGRKDFSVHISCDTQAELLRIKELLAEADQIDEPDIREKTRTLESSRINFSLEVLHEGFLLPESKIAFYTEHQIFGRLKRRGKRRKTRFRGLARNELYQLRKGDYVVHADFGIGRFDGLKKIRVHDVEQEVVKLLYEENDTLYVNLNYLSKIRKYSSKEGHIPKLTRLGTADWEKLKSRAKRRVKEIARDLIRLYARRKHEPGFAFQKDTLWQKELEASFMYEDTIDQARATLEVKRDMEASFPMDRLVCGDVGFGKTEVAVRSAFKAVLSGKQVAVLVPTTILALQHYNTFLDRTTKYATNVQVISRLKSRADQSRILEDLKAGRIDIIIGTHRLLSKDVAFKDLGLLIIDEEHRFGVAAKEKLRMLKTAVDTLTLTATPIPRTLHFSLMGARDLSIIATPPRNRLSIITEITRYDDQLIRDAILKEVHRGGQVYFVHDRVSSIEDVTARLRVILPEVRMRFAHGQMHAHELEDAMLEFLEKKSDVLVCTKIIESGLDIPNVNTIVVNRADRFGLAELYQLRGRVGRSNVQAYAYLLIPPISVLPKSTLQKLQALEEHTELGSGFNLAMRDLEIRGAGNLLGGEQSGFIETLGFEMYTKILEEAVLELKEDEFQNLFGQRTVEQKATKETAIEAEFDALIPGWYVQDDAERLAVYQRLYGLKSRAQLNELRMELKDRFGTLPEEVENLLWVVRLRLSAGRLGFPKVVICRGHTDIEFPPESEKSFYRSESFQRIMSFISKQKTWALLSQSGTLLKLRMAHAQMVAEEAFSKSEAILFQLIDEANDSSMETAETRSVSP